MWRKLLFSVVALGVTLPVSGQRKAAATSGIAPAFLSGRFESVERFRTGFKGHSAEVLWSTLTRNSKRYTKSEYETQAAFEARLQTFATQPLLGTIRPADNFAFVVPAISTYDAETRRLMVLVPFTQPYLDEERWAIFWSGHTVPHGSYIGTNAFGVKKLVRRETRTYQMIALPELPEWVNWDAPEPPGDSDSGPKFAIPMSPQAAQLRKYSLQTVLIGSLEPPYGSETKDFRSATIDDPRDIITVNHVVHMKVEQIWLFDQRTGEVYAKFGSEEHQRRWPLHVDLRAADGYAVDRLSATVDGKETIHEKSPYANNSLHIDARSEVRLTLTQVHNRPGYDVTVNGSPATWDCVAGEDSFSRTCSLTASSDGLLRRR